MGTKINQLLEQVSRGDAVTGKAALVLGMLLERETVSRPEGDDGGLRAVLGDGWASQRLAPDMRHAAVAALASQISGPAPNVTAVWALSKSADPNGVPALAALLARTQGDPVQGNLALQTLNAIVVLGPGTREHDAAVAAIRGAVASVDADVAQSASQWLRLHGGSEAGP